MSWPTRPTHQPSLAAAQPREIDPFSREHEFLRVETTLLGRNGQSRGVDSCLGKGKRPVTPWVAGRFPFAVRQSRGALLDAGVTHRGSLSFALVCGKRTPGREAGPFLPRRHVVVVVVWGGGRFTSHTARA